MNKKYLYTNILLCICSIACLVIYDIFGGLWLKGVTSSWFVLLGLVNVFYAYKTNYTNKKFILLIFTGLFFGMLADILLGINFIFGVLFFALGHILYLAAYYTIEPFSKKEFYFILPISCFATFIIIGTPFIIVPNILRFALIGYGIIISIMLSKAICNYQKHKTIGFIFIMTGSLLFYFSDIMLAIDLFGTPSRLVWILCSYTYWPAQTLLAHSLYHIVKR